MSTIATLTIEMAANIARLQVDMDQAKRVVNDSMKSIEQAVGLAKNAFVAIAGVSSVDAFAGMIRSSIEATAKLHDLAAQTGATVGALSAMASIGKTSDTGLDAITSAMNKLAKNMAGATEDTKGAGKALEALGIDFSRFKGLSPDEQMQAVAKAMSNFADGAGKSAVAMALYGKEGAKMIPFLKDLAEVGELHAKVTAEQAAMADNFSDNLVKLKASGEGWKKELAMGLLPALNDASQAFLDVLSGAGGLRDGIRELSADGTLAEWTRNGVIALTYLIDVIEALFRVIQQLWMAAKTVFEQLGEVFTGVGKAFNEAVKGNFSEAAKELATGFEKAEFTAIKATVNMDEAWSKQLLGEKIRQRMEDLKGLGATAEETKPAMDFTNVLNNNKDAADKQVKAYSDLVASINEKIATAKLETEVGGKLTEAQKLQIEITKQVEKGTISLKDATSAHTKALLADLTAAENFKAVQEDLRKINEEVWKDYLKNAEALQKSAQAIDEKVKKQIEENDAIGKTKSQLLQEEIARLRVQAATMAQTVAEEEYLGVCTRETIAHKDSLDALNKLIDAKDQGVHLQAAKEASDAWQKTAGSIEQALTDSLMRGFESGKSMMESLRNYIVNAFKSTTVKLLVQPVMGALGLGGSASALASSSSSAGGVASLFSTAKNIYNGGMSLLDGSLISGQVGNAWAGFSASGIGQSLGLSTPTADIMGELYNSPTALSGQIGSGLGVLGNGFAGVGIGSMLAGNKSLGGMNGMAMSAIGAAVGSIIPGIGTLLGGVIGGALDAAFGHGPKEFTASGLQGSVTGGAATGQSYANWHQDGGWFSSDRNGTDYSAWSSSVATALNTGASAVYQQTQAWAKALKLPADQLSTVTHDFKIALGNDATANQQAIAQMFAGYQSELVSQYSDYLSQFRLEGEALADTMSRLVVIQTFSDNIRDLGGIFVKVSDSSFQARQNLIDMAGGIDKLAGQINQFVSDYYTTAEKEGLQAKSIADALKAVGIDANGLMTREDYRALVESRDVNTEQGRQQLALLLQFGPQFAQLADYLKQTGLNVQAAIQDAPTNGVLAQMVDPAQTTATAVTSMAASVDTSNTLLTQISNSLTAIQASADAAVTAANSAATAANSAVTAAQAATSAASLITSAPTYTYNIGGA
jgi:hypothetical protein